MSVWSKGVPDFVVDYRVENQFLDLKSFVCGDGVKT